MVNGDLQEVQTTGEMINFLAENTLINGKPISEPMIDNLVGDFISEQS